MGFPIDAMNMRSQLYLFLR